MELHLESIDTTFVDLREWINNEGHVRDNIRVAVKELDDLSKSMAVVLADIHSEGGVNKLPEICTKARQFLPDIQSKLKEWPNLFPPTEYYHYHEMWWSIMQRLSCLVGLIIFLESGKFATREDVAALIGVYTDPKDGFILDLEDYLMGILYLCSDLSRFAVNSVINNNYEHPVQILKFLTELSVGFRLLNFKNDWLRKRFDGLKYDVKKVEEITYDLSMRGLIPNKPQSNKVSGSDTNANTSSQKEVTNDSTVVRSGDSSEVTNIDTDTNTNTSSQAEVIGDNTIVRNKKSNEVTHVGSDTNTNTSSQTEETGDSTVVESEKNSKATHVDSDTNANSSSQTEVTGNSSIVRSEMSSEATRVDTDTNTNTSNQTEVSVDSTVVESEMSSNVSNIDT